MASFKMLLACVLAMIFAPTVFADISDPDVVQSVLAGSCQNTWCVAQFYPAVDPNTGLTTLEDVLTSTTVVTGWDKILDTDGSYWLLDFVTISGGTYNGDPGMFVYCYSTTGKCSSEDSGVPSASDYTLSATSTANSSPQFQATSGIAGYASNDAPNAAALADGTASPNNKCSSAATCSDYFIDLSNGGHGVGSTNGSVVPEPSSVILFGSLLMIAGGAIRRRVRKNDSIS